MRRRCLVWFLAASLGLSLAPRDAHAWGDEGHRAVGELAFRLLSPQAQQAVREALSEPGYESLAEAATWPDTYARRFHEYDAMKPFHYVDVKATASSYVQQRDCEHGCVVSALTQFILLLESHDPELSLAERRRAIYWTAHLMGDIHQPLHIAHPDGKGGNATLLAFFDAPERKSAHWIWDSGLIEQHPLAPSAAGAANPPAEAEPEPPYLALTRELVRDLTPAKRQAWQRTTDPEQLANEGLRLAQRWAFLRSDDHVDAAYEASRWPVVEQQLQKAGVRLAAVLEHALGAH